VLIASLTLLCRPLTFVAAKWQKLVRIAGNPYRPELHYMRGPGPKWHAKFQASRPDRMR
jgi:hypothetical protein